MLVEFHVWSIVAWASLVGALQRLQNVKGLKIKVSPFLYSSMPYLEIGKIYFVLLLKCRFVCTK